MTGGGSGGHITPLIATAAELKRLQPDAKLIYVGQKGDSFGREVADSDWIDEARFISAGKFRRYHGEGWRQLLDIKTWLLNIRDFFRFLCGIVQSIELMYKLKPEVVFIKGGFVGVPVGLAAALLRVPYVTHDSDAIPGLANRIIKRWARLHAVALPAGEYKIYPEAKTVTVGIPLRASYKQVDRAAQIKAKETVGLSQYKRIVMVTGGGLGAERLNNLVVKIAPKLLARFPDLALVHQAGEKLQSKLETAYEKELQAPELDRLRLLGFVNNLAEYSAASDVIVTRAGATTLAEFGLQEKACIVVPNAQLTGGHQLKNAQILEKAAAAVLVTDQKDHYLELMDAIVDLLESEDRRLQLARNLAKMSHSKAATELATLLLKVARGSTSD